MTSNLFQLYFSRDVEDIKLPRPPAAGFILGVRKYSISLRPPSLGMGRRVEEQMMDPKAVGFQMEVWLGLVILSFLRSLSLLCPSSSGFLAKLFLLLVSVHIEPSDATV